MRHLLDLYLWSQVAKIWWRVLEVLLILVAERATRLVAGVLGFFVPSLVHEWLRTWWVALGNVAWTRGRRDPDRAAELDFSTPQLCAARGYACEEHYAATRDGFVLCLHRIPRGRDACAQSHNGESADAPGVDAESSPRRDATRPPVLLLHGFLQSSEAWVSTAHGLPFALADAGFDVWMANVRGNKYSCKHTSLSPHDDRYWNFSFDDVAQHDVPTNVRHVLSVTGFESLTFIGFSQGTACGFAALSLLPELNRMVHLFIALAPCTALHGFSNKLVDALTRTSPDIVYLIFGRRRLLPSVPFWQSVLSTRTYIYLIERSIALLFGWDMRNVWPEDKPVVYAHLYSFSSVKSVVHWFQLLQTGRFQMYDDHLWRQQSAAYQQPQYRLSQIRTAVALFPGGRDTLPNTAVTLAQLPPRRVLAHTIPSFEHMDFLYSKLACRELHPHVIALCRAAAAGETARDGDWARRMAARLKLGADGEGAVSVHAAAAAAAAAELSEGDGASAGAGGAGSWEALALGTRVSPMRTVGGVLVDDDDAADAPGGGDQLDDEDPLVREQREQEEARAEQERQSRELRDALREAEDECAAAGEQPNLQQDPQDDAEVLLQPPPLPQPRPQHRQRKRGAPRDGARV